jgi:uncharacterized Zn finger protein
VTSDDRVRGFPAFARSVRGSRRFARSWWGQAWLAALEDTSLDQEQLVRGRAYARSGRVGPIAVSPGRITATVYGDGGEEYRSAVLVAQLTRADWDRLLDTMAATTAHLAALLDGDMPRQLVEAAADVGVRLLPGRGDLQPECDCLDWDFPCKHAAALCYQAGWLLDSDPFALLLMRGRSQREIVDGLRTRNSRLNDTPAAAAETQPVPELGAARPLPDPPPAVSELDYVLTVPPGPGVDPDELRGLAAAAAARARDLLALSPTLAGQPCGVGRDQLDDVDHDAVGVGAQEVPLPEGLVDQVVEDRHASRPQPALFGRGISDDEADDNACDISVAIRHRQELVPTLQKADLIGLLAIAEADEPADVGGGRESEMLLVEPGGGRHIVDDEAGAEFRDLHDRDLHFGRGVADVADGRSGVTR